jgi:hypothetical protein
MALDIFEVLVSFLCPTNEAASSCREFIQNHNSVLPPIGPLFYFLLFPLIFTILFVYIISDKVLFGGQLKWAKVLIGISVFIFIIISGLYPVALVLSEFWYIAIVILGIFYFLFSHKKGGGGGGGGKAGGSMPGFGSITGGVIGGAVNYGAQKVLRRGQETPAERIVSSRLNMLEGVLLSLEDTENERAKSDLRGRFTEMMDELEKSELPNIEREYGREVYMFILKKYEKVISDLKNRFKNQKHKK